MKKTTILLLFVCVVRLAEAQNANIDSLIHVAMKARHAIISFSPNRDSLFKRLPGTKTTEERTKLIYQIIDYGRTASTQGFRYHYKILNWAKQSNDLVSEAIITAEIGFNIAANGDNAGALKTCFRALKLAETTGNEQAIGIAYENLAVCSQNNANLFKYYTLKALQHSKAGNDDLYTSYELSNLGTAYLALHKIDSARYFCFKSFEWCVTKQVISGTPHALIVFAMLLDDKEKLRYFNTAKKIAVIYNDNENYNYAQLSIGGYYQKHHQPDSAIYYGRHLYNNSKRLSLVIRIGPVRLLAKGFTGINADSALKYTLEYYAIRDSLQNINQIEREQSIAFAEEQSRRELEAQKSTYQINLRFYILAAVIVFLFSIALIFWGNNRKSKKVNKLLHQQKDQVQDALRELEVTQTQLIQSEKMASLGELTAGIAHEIQNPLNFVNNFSEVNKEMLEELKAESKKPKAERDMQLETELINDLIENEQKINHHGKRADAIVKGMLQHSRLGSGTKEPTNINLLAEEYLRLSYHGLRSKDKSFNAVMATDFDEKLPKINVVPQDIGRVMLNLFNNAFYAVNQKARKAGIDYKPEVSVTTSHENGQVVIKVKDNGVGIPDAIKDKIMQPFFTTKPTGEGTGLGLSLTYDMVVKGHEGSIAVDTKEGEYTIFIVQLPANV